MKHTSFSPVFSYFCNYILVNRMKHFLAVILLTFSSCFAVKAQINTDQVFQIGRNALYFEDYVLSIQYFNQVISAKPYLAQPYFFRALAKFNLDDFKGAEQDASIAIDHNPFITDAYELRGVTRQNLGMIREAVEDYDKALEMLPENKSVLFNKALALEQIKDFDEARRCYEVLLDAHPSFDGGYLGRARLNLSAGDTIAAIADIDKALELNKNAVNGYIMRADIAINRNQDYANALTDMDEAIRLQPKQAGLFINRAFLRYKLDDYYGAMSDYDYAIQLDPLNTVALYNRALLRMEVHDFPHAIEDLSAVLTLRPDDYRAHYNRAMVYLETKDYDKALSDVNHVISVFPDLASAYFLRYHIKQAKGDRSADSDHTRSLALAKKRIRLTGSSSEIDELTSASDDSGDAGSEPQEVVAARFSSLITIRDNSAVEQAYDNRSIRGKVQDRNLNIEIEPLFVVTYYTSPTELKSTGEYMREVDDINRTHALNYTLQVTNREVTLTDPDEINRHFESIDYYNSYLATHTPRAVDYFGRAMNQMTVHNYKAAITDFERALAASPDFTLARFMLAVARYRNISSESADTESTQQLSHNDMRLKYHEVLEEFDRVLEQRPDLALAYFNRGVILVEMLDFTSALTAFNKAIELKPDFGEAYYNRGYVYFKLGNRQAGNADLSKAGELGVVPSYNLLKRMSN